MAQAKEKWEDEHRTAFIAAAVGGLAATVGETERAMHGYPGGWSRLAHDAITIADAVMARLPVEEATP